MPTDHLPSVGDSDRQLLVKIHLRLDALEATVSRLDDSVTGLLTAVDEEIADLRAKLAQAQADDATAAEVAADVEENISRIEAAAATLRENDAPAEEPTPEEPPAEEPTDPEAPVA